MPLHTIPPVYDAQSRVLILGSFPSVKSRETAFFYGHAQNRFWRVLAAILDAPLPQTIEEKRALLIAHGIALWDVVGSCELVGSQDNTIRNVVPNDISRILHTADIRRIYANGQTAYRLYTQYCPDTLLPARPLPSTSPANAQYSLPRLIEAWRVVADCARSDER